MNQPSYMNQPVAEPVSSGHAGTIQRAPKMGCSSNGPDEPRTHTDATNKQRSANFRDREISP